MGSTPVVNLSGFSSGLPVEDIITQLMAVERRPVDQLRTRKDTINKRQTQYDAAADRISRLSDALKKLTDPALNPLTSGNNDLFRARKATVSDSTILSATVANNATPQSLTVEVTQLATATRARSLSGVGASASNDTPIANLAQGGMTTGSFTVFVNGTQNTVTVGANQTLGQVLSNVLNISGIQGASVDTDGRVNIEFAAGTNVQFGSNGDTSNFLDLAGLKTGTRTATQISGGISLTSINLNASVESTASGLGTTVQAGSQFRIGNKTFDTAGKSLQALITEINGAPEAGVVASFNTAQNRLELTSRSTGSGLISLQEVSGNFLASTKLISSGNSALSQTAGVNAQFRINGGDLQSSTSNTVQESISGLSGVTLNLAKAAVGSPTTITIAENPDDLKTAIRDVVNAFNVAIAFIDEQTNSQSDRAQLKNDAGLLRLRSQLRQTLSAAVPGQPSGFSSLQSVGISTGAVSASATGTASSTVQINETKLAEALSTNPEAVRNLFVGASGTFSQLKSLVDNALKDDADASRDGLFATYKNTTQTRIRTMDDNIRRGEERLERREQLLRNQFRAMEQLISQYQSQSSAIGNLSSQLGL